MQFVNLLFAALLQFSLGHTASKSFDHSCGYSNTVVSSGFIGRVDTYKLGLIPEDKPEAQGQACYGFLSGQYRKGSELLGNVADVTSVNFESLHDGKLYGVKRLGERASASLTGWWYAPLDGSYTFEVSVLSASSITFQSFPCGNGVYSGSLYHACAPYKTSGKKLSFTWEFQAGVYYPISLNYVQAENSAKYSASVILPDGSKVEDIGSMVYQIEQEKQVSSSKSSTSRSSTTTTTTSSSATSYSSAYKPVPSSSSSSAYTPASSTLSSQYSSSTREWNSTYPTSSSSTPSASPTSIQPSATSSNMPASATSSNSTLTSAATTTMTSIAENGNTTVLTLTLTLTSTFTYCPECENSAAETVSIPTTTQTETVVVTSTNAEGQTVILTKTITTTYCPESEPINAKPTTLVIPTSSPVSISVGNTDFVTNEATSTICTTCTGSGNGSEDESGAISGIDYSSVSEPAFTYDSEPAFTYDSAIAYTSKSGIDFDTVSGEDFHTVTEDAYTNVSKIVFSTISGNTYSTATGNSLSSASGNSSYIVSPTAAVSTYDGSGSAMGMISSLAILPLLALLV